MTHERGDDAAVDRDAGVWNGRPVARRFESPDGFTVLVGKSARDNDTLTFKVARANDLWMHVASGPGSHVVVRNPDNLPSLPRDTVRFAAALAVGYSSARKGGRSAVHVARRSDVSKPRGWAPGKVALRRYKTVQASPLREPGAASSRE